jgi:hypothetical protein
MSLQSLRLTPECNQRFQEVRSHWRRPSRNRRGVALGVPRRYRVLDLITWSNEFRLPQPGRPKIVPRHGGLHVSWPATPLREPRLTARFRRKTPCTSRASRVRESGRRLPSRSGSNHALLTSQTEALSARSRSLPRSQRNSFKEESLKAEEHQHHW